MCQAQPWALCSRDVRSSCQQHPPPSRGYHQPPFTDEGTEAPRAEMTCPTSQLKEAELGFQFQSPRLGPLVWHGSGSWMEGAGTWETQPVLHHHPCKERQPEGQGPLGTQGLAVGGPWPSHQETQFKSCVIHLIMIPYAL